MDELPDSQSAAAPELPPGQEEIPASQAVVPPPAAPPPAASPPAAPQSAAPPPAAPQPLTALATFTPQYAAPPPPPAPRTDWGKVMRNILRTILGLILAVIFGGLIGLGIFLGLPWLYNSYVLPVQQHEQRLDALETQYASQVTLLETGSRSQQDTIDDLETQLAQVTADLEAFQSAQSGGQEQMALELAALSESLAGLESQFEQLDTDLSALEPALQEQQGIVTTLQTGSQEQAAQLAELRQDIAVLKAMEMISRARLFLMQNNLGLAQLDIDGARTVLAALQPDLSENRAQVLASILLRLDLARQNLEAAPVLVVDDLEVAWQLLRRGLDAPLLQSVINVTPTLPALSEVLTATLPVSPTLTLVPETPTPAP